MEDFGGKKQTLNGMALSHKRKRSMENSDQSQNDTQSGQTWKEILGPVPPMGNTKVTKIVINCERLLKQNKYTEIILN